jgi:hypothetical protein
VSYSGSVGSLVILTKGRELRQASICVVQVVSSSNVNIVVPITLMGSVPLLL